MDQIIHCRSCQIAGYLEEESLIEWYGQEEAASIRALAVMWHDRCTGCDCEVKPRERALLSLVRTLAAARRLLHVHGMPRQLDKQPERQSCT